MDDLDEEPVKIATQDAGGEIKIMDESPLYTTYGDQRYGWEVSNISKAQKRPALATAEGSAPCVFGRFKRTTQREPVPPWRGWPAYPPLEVLGALGPSPQAGPMKHPQG